LHSLWNKRFHRLPLRIHNHQCFLRKVFAFCLSTH
jgi:hypothetical protein